MLLDKSSSHSNISHIVIDHLIKRPLSLAWIVLGFDSTAKATTKKSI